MTSTTWAITCLVLMVLILSALLYLALREFRKTQESQKEVALAQTALLSKMGSLLASKDAMAYQAIQAMENWNSEPSSSPSVTLPSEEELDALLIRANNGEELTEEQYDFIERSALGTITYPGRAL